VHAVIIASLGILRHHAATLEFVIIVESTRSLHDVSNTQCIVYKFVPLVTAPRSIRVLGSLSCFMVSALQLNACCWHPQYAKKKWQSPLHIPAEKILV